MSAIKVFNSVTKKVLDAVNTVISSDTPDEKLEGYRTRLTNLSNEFDAVKEAMKKYSKTLQALAAAGKGINDELFSFYAGSSRVQSSLPIFANSQKVIDSVVEKNMKEKMGWECLKQFDDWSEECNKMRDKIKKTEDAQTEVRNVDSRVQALRSAKEKKLQRGQQLTVQEENTLKAGEDMLRKHQAAMTKMKASLDDQITRFLNDRHMHMDSMFVRFMELQLDTTQLMQNASLSFTPIIESYRRRYPLNVTNEGIIRNPIGGNITSPTNSGAPASVSPSNGTNGIPSMVSSNSSPRTSDAKSAPNPVKKNSNAPPPKSLKNKKKHQSDDEESEEDGSDDESDEDSEDENADESSNRKAARIHHHQHQNAAPAPGEKRPGKVSTGGTLNAPIGSPTAVPVSAPPTVARSSSASPVPPIQPVPATPSGTVIDFLNFGGSSASNSSPSSATDLPSSKPLTQKQSSLLDMFSSGASSTSSAASSSSSSRNSSSLEFDFSGTLGSPTRSASAAAASASASSNSFDPLGEFNLPNESSSRSNTLKPARSIPMSQSHDDFDPLNTNKRSKLDDIDEGPSSSSSGPSLDSVDDGDAKPWLPGDLDLHKSMLDEKLNAWEFSNGQQKPIHTLLSTLSSILWPNSGWKAPNISELMDLNGIKKWKRKAAQSIHPDKQVNASPAQQYMSKRVFAAMNAAFQKYTGQGPQGMVYY